MMNRFTFSDQRGQALIEAALVIFFLVPIMLGVIDLSTILQDYQELATAADAGAAYAAWNTATLTDLADTTTAACASNSAGSCGAWTLCTGSNSTLSVSLATAADTEYTNDTGTKVTVTVKCTVNYPISASFLPKSVTLSSAVAKRVHP